MLNGFINTPWFFQVLSYLPNAVHEFTLHNGNLAPRRNGLDM